MTTITDTLSFLSFNDPNHQVAHHHTQSNHITPSTVFQEFVKIHTQPSIHHSRNIRKKGLTSHHTASTSSTTKNPSLLSNHIYHHQNPSIPSSSTIHKKHESTSIIHDPDHLKPSSPHNHTTGAAKQENDIKSLSSSTHPHSTSFSSSSSSSQYPSSIIPPPLSSNTSSTTTHHGNIKKPHNQTNTTTTDTEQRDTLTDLLSSSATSGNHVAHSSRPTSLSYGDKDTHRDAYTHTHRSVAAAGGGGGFLVNEKDKDKQKQHTQRKQQRLRRQSILSQYSIDIINEFQDDNQYLPIAEQYYPSSTHTHTHPRTRNGTRNTARKSRMVESSRSSTRGGIRSTWTSHLSPSSHPPHTGGKTISSSSSTATAQQNTSTLPSVNPSVMNSSKSDLINERSISTHNKVHPLDVTHSSDLSPDGTYHFNEVLSIQMPSLVIRFDHSEDEEEHMIEASYSSNNGMKKSDDTLLYKEERKEQQEDEMNIKAKQKKKLFKKNNPLKSSILRDALLHSHHQQHTDDSTVDELYLQTQEYVKHSSSQQQLIDMTLQQQLPMIISPRSHSVTASLPTNFNQNQKNQR